MRVTQRPSISTSLYKLSCLLSRCVARCHNHDHCSFSIHCSVVRRSCVAAAALANAPLARTQREPRCCCLCPGQRPALNASGACRLLDLSSLGLQTVTVLAPGKPAAAPGSRLKFTVVRPRTITRPPPRPAAATAMFKVGHARSRGHVSRLLDPDARLRGQQPLQARSAM